MHAAKSDLTTMAEIKSGKVDLVDCVRIVQYMEMMSDIEKANQQKGGE